MKWQMHRIVLQMKSPLHIGWNRVGNIQRTRPYVTGRVLWGALTHRLARDAYRQNPTSRAFSDCSERISATMAFTYFYPAVATPNGLAVHWPWSGEQDFAYRFLRSYPGTALVYPQKAAAEGTLHEIEYLSPRTLDGAGAAVYLWGYIFTTTEAPDTWQKALGRMQLGGERGYGWGDVAVESNQAESATHALFQLNDITLDLTQDRPLLTLPPATTLLAHTRTPNLPARGQTEPFVGREEPREQPGHSGQHVKYEDVCFMPGSQLTKPATLAIGANGIWEAVATALAPL